MKTWWLLGMMMGLGVFAVFSFSLTDPNLVISTWPAYWNWQLWMWQTFFNNPVLLSWSYVALVTMLGSWWIWGLWSHRQVRVSSSTPMLGWPQLLFSIVFISLPLWPAYNALSHDVFNYMFNAKMVWYYHANPHQQVALDFPQDDWLRFMHNTHTPAPYGYGWTALSVPISWLGWHKFLSTWLMFRVAGVASLLGLAATTWWLLHNTRSQWPLWQWLFVFGNPLVLIEVVANSHNDIWMMWPAVGAMAVLTTSKPRQILTLTVAAVLIVASISIKFATVLLLPVLIWLAWTNSQKSKVWWPVLCSILMFLPLLTSRSQQFHPWYLTWSLVWIPFFELNKLPQWVKLWPATLGILSLSSLWRYWPWLRWGQFTTEVLWQQKLITWLPLSLVVIWGLRQLLLQHRRQAAL